MSLRSTLAIRPFLGVLLLALVGAGRAAAEPAPDPSGPPDAPPSAPSVYAPDQLDQLLGPVALYPDPLLALILPSAAAPADIVAAAGFLAAHGDPYDAVSQPWAESVRGLVHYPEVIEWMAQNLGWVQAVGAAFVADPEGATQAIQRLRHRARDLGTLVSTPQQEVIEEDGLLEIEPAESDQIYVPRYDPGVVFVEGDPAYGPFLTFGVPYSSGVWLNYGFDWRRRALWVGRFSRDGMGWRRPNAFNAESHAWRPPAGAAQGRPFPGRPGPGPNPAFIRPNLLPGAPRSSPEDRARWNNFHARPGENAATDHFGRPNPLPGSRPGVPAGADWRAREREDRERAGHRPDGANGTAAHAPVHPPASAPRPVPAERDKNDPGDHTDRNAPPAR